MTEIAFVNRRLSVFTISEPSLWLSRWISFCLSICAACSLSMRPLLDFFVRYTLGQIVLAISPCCCSEGSVTNSFSSALYAGRHEVAKATISTCSWLQGSWRVSQYGLSRWESRSIRCLSKIYLSGGSFPIRFLRATMRVCYSINKESIFFRCYCSNKDKQNFLPQG